MIYSVTAINHKRESLKLELARPERSGIIVEKIDGLGPTDVTINSCAQAAIDGAVFNTSRIGTRAITLTLRMMFAPTVEDSRHKVYRYFPIKKHITLLFETDTRTSQISGYVQRNEPDIFSEEEKCVITLFCTDPFFYALGDNEMVFSGTRPYFEFEWENELTDPPNYEGSIDPDPLKDNDAHLEMSILRLDTRATLYYDGDIDTGVTITISALEDEIKNITLNNITDSNNPTKMEIATDQIKKITGEPFKMGDDIIISTVGGKKYVQLYRDGKYTNILGALKKDATWFVLTPGNNVFDFTAEKRKDYIDVTFAYRTAYAGI